MRSSSLRLVQQVLRVVGEAAWLYAWSSALGHWLDPTAGPVLPLWLVICVLVASSALAGPATRRSASPRMAVAVSLVGVAISVAAGLLATDLSLGALDLGTLSSTPAGTRALVAGSLALAAWWRGSRVGANAPSTYEVEGQFRFGVLAMAGLLALIAVVGSGAAPEAGTLVGPALAVVASGLLGLPLARIAELSGTSRADSPPLAPSGPWLGTLLVIVGGLLLLTLLFAGVVTAERLGTVLGLGLGTVARVVWVLFLLVALPLGYVVEWLVGLLKALLTGRAVEQPLPQQPPLDQLLRDQQNPSSLPLELQIIVDLVLAAIIVGVVVLLLTRALARRRGWQREPDGVEELRESVFGWDAVLEMIAWLLGRLRRSQARPAALVVDPDPVQPRSVREVYREFLRLTARLGFPREASETPIEYASRVRLERLSGSAELGQAEESAGEPELEALTSTYVLARYGPPSSAPPDAGPVARALERLRELWTSRRTK